MNARSAASALILDLIASGSFTAGQVSACDYGILDGGHACALIVQPTTSRADMIAMGGGATYTWGVGIEGYIKDTGNPVEVLRRVWDLHSAVGTAIESGANLNSNIRSWLTMSFNRPRDTFVTYGGLDWIPVYITAEVFETG